MDCVIKVVKGPGEGDEFRCIGGETVVGRSPRSHVRLGSPSVSFEHAVILRNGDDFFVENLSASGTFINDERIAGRVRLRAKDRIRLGQETVVRVEAIPASSGDSSRRRLLIFAVLAMLVLLILVLLFNPLGPSTNTTNWKIAYAKIDEWAQSEVAAGHLPADVTDHLEKAWRLRTAGDAPAAATEWLRLHVLLAGIENKTTFNTAATANRRALDDLLHPPKNAPALTDEEMGAALVQFVSQMERQK